MTTQATNIIRLGAVANDTVRDTYADTVRDTVEPVQSLASVARPSALPRKSERKPRAQRPASIAWNAAAPSADVCQKLTLAELNPQPVPTTGARRVLRGLKAVARALATAAAVGATKAIVRRLRRSHMGRRILHTVRLAVMAYHAAE